MKFIHRLGAEESGQALTEYALLMGFLLFASVAFAAGYTNSIAGVTNSVNSNLMAAAASASSGTCRPRSNCDPIQQNTVSRKIWSQVN
jgi:Flp pilus assembly pilin Flp